MNLNPLFVFWDGSDRCGMQRIRLFMMLTDKIVLRYIFIVL